MRLYELLEKAAENAIFSQRPDGSLPGGHNGPYHDPETPVRNTAHWLVTFLKLYDVTGEERFVDAARDATDYLRSDEARPNRYTFFHRTEETKNSCNGLIGQAWTIEALAVAADRLGDPELASLAEEVFLLHPFDEQLGLWKCVEIDGEILAFDGTFNHQLWFAAAGGLLGRQSNVSKRVDRRVSTFLDMIESNLGLYDLGLIKHGVRASYAPGRSLRLLRNDRRGRLFFIQLIGRSSLTEVTILRELVEHPVFPLRRPPLTEEHLRRKAVGYHSFNMYALALLHQVYPDHQFWQRELFRRCYAYMRSSDYETTIGESEYGFPYNPPGIEVPFALEVFEDEPDREVQERWLARQFERCYDVEEHRMNENNPDPETLTARLYQASRLPDLRVRLDRPLQRS